MVYPNWIWYILLVVAPFFLNQAECIRNGELVEDVNEFKYIVGLRIKFEETGQLCGGAILDDYHILTAAHCLVNQTNNYEHPKKVNVRLHTLINQDSMFQMKRYAQKLYFPSAYFRNNKNDGLFENDIAVIKVKKSMKLAGNSEKLQRVELPEPNHITAGDRGVFAGYGVDFEYHEVKVNDHRLRKLDVEVVGQNRCPTEKIMRSRTLMCVKPNPVDVAKPQGVCYGDSGSPLVIKQNERLLVVGVSSNVEDEWRDCDNSKASGFFTKVHKFTNWIRNVLSNTYDAEETTVIEMAYTTSCFW